MPGPFKRPVPSKPAGRAAPTNGPQRQRKTLKRKRESYDLEDTFEVAVGKLGVKPKRFTIYTSVFTGRSGALGKVNGVQMAVDLNGEDPELFQAYLNCVYFGPETMEQWADAFKESDEESHDETQRVADAIFVKLIRFYLLAERLVGFKTANMVIREMIRFSDAAILIPTQFPVTLVYAASEAGSPLRKLLRDLWIYDSIESDTERLHTGRFPLDLLQDVALEMLRVTKAVPSEDFSQTVKDIYVSDKCRYHQHDELHPKCVAGDSDEDFIDAED